MNEMIRLDLPLLLPDVPDERDQCVQRLTALLSEQVGVARVHVLLPDDAEDEVERSASSKAERPCGRRRPVAFPVIYEGSARHAIGGSWIRCCLCVLPIIRSLVAQAATAEIILKTR